MVVARSNERQTAVKSRSVEVELKYECNSSSCTSLKQEHSYSLRNAGGGEGGGRRVKGPFAAGKKIF